MFLEPTTILVGAGASAEFGLPTGEAIYSAAAKEDVTFRNKTADNEAQFFSTFWEYLCFSNDGRSQSEFKSLVTHLQTSSSYSIDLYGFYNPSKSRIAKYYTAWSLIKCHFEMRERIDRFDQSVWRYGERHYPWRRPYVGGADRRANWLGVLSNQFLSGATKTTDLEQNQLVFVTLNYDSAIEETFGTFVRNHEKFADTPDELLPRVVHVHGQLDQITNESVNVNFFRQQADNIKFISDSIEEPSATTAQAVACLQDSLSVYAVGFAFEKNNCKLLQAGSWGHKAAALNFAGDTRSYTEMQRMGLKKDMIWQGNSAAPKYLGVAAAEGFFAL